MVLLWVVMVLGPLFGRHSLKDYTESASKVLVTLSVPVVRRAARPLNIRYHGSEKALYVPLQPFLDSPKPARRGRPKVLRFLTYPARTGSKSHERLRASVKIEVGLSVNNDPD